jgi:hypothetical protein
MTGIDSPSALAARRKSMHQRLMPKICKSKRVWHGCIASALLWLADRGNPLLCWQFISLQASSGSARTLSQRVSPGSGSIKLDNFLLAVLRDSAT